MRIITLIAAVTVVGIVGFVFLFGNDTEGPTQLAEDELLGLKDHFKSLDAVAVDTKL